MEDGGSVVSANTDIGPMKFIAWNCVHGEDVTMLFAGIVWLGRRTIFA